MLSDHEIQAIRQDFPCLQQSIQGKPLIYFDSAATALKPRPVIEAVTDYYSKYCGNVHRGVHALSAKATALYENTRETVRAFINANSLDEIIFTKGATESINLVANSYGGHHLKKGDEIILSAMEHHANIVPWQMLCERIGCQLKVIPLTPCGELDLEAFVSLLSERTRFVSIILTSNVTGVTNPVQTIIAKAHEKSVPVLVDAAQAVVHQQLDVQALDCDFLVFSGHKLCGPTGVGVLYAKAKYLEDLPPYQGGGDMIASVSFEKTLYKSGALRFEAGTPNIAGVIGLGKAIEYITSVGLKNIAAYEHKLAQTLQAGFDLLPKIRVLGSFAQRAPVFSFVHQLAHSHDVAVLIDQLGVALRDGHHCAMPLMTYFGVSSTVRASLLFYNTLEEVDKFFDCLRKVCEILA